MEEKNPSIWKQYGPMILMGSCCLAPALIGGAISLAATTGLGLSAPLTVVVLGGAGVYVWSRQRRQAAQAGQAGMPCCPTSASLEPSSPESSDVIKTPPAVSKEKS